MPIKPENRLRYPANWTEISARIRRRARNCCEQPGCGLHNYSVGMWVPDYRLGKRWEPLAGMEGSSWAGSGRGEMPYPEECARMDFAGQGLDYPSLQPLTFKQASALAEHFWANDREYRLIVIVLTVAHLDHQPENCKPSNLRLLCQRHHLAYDLQHHKTTAYMARMARRGNLELPL